MSSQLKLGPPRDFECDRVHDLWAEQFSLIGHEDDVLDGAFDRDTSRIWCLTIGSESELVGFSIVCRFQIEAFSHNYSAFDRFTSMLAYKAEMDGITVEQVPERDTSKSCSCCGRTRKANRVERGLYVCDGCGTVGNADVNGAENIRQKVSPSPSQDRSNGWLAQPSTFLFDKETGAFAPQEQVTS